MRRAVYTIGYATLLSVIGTTAFAGPIHIESGKYSDSCGVSQIDVTRELADDCNSLKTCMYPVAIPESFKNAGAACKADLVTEWSCGAGDTHSAEVWVSSGSMGTLVMSCAVDSGAGK